MGAVAAVTAAQEVLPAMRAAGRGTLLFTGSGVALKPWAPGAALGMQKAALRSYVFALADEVGPLGIHAATVTIQGVVGVGAGVRADRAGRALLDPAHPAARRLGDRARRHRVAHPSHPVIMRKSARGPWVLGALRMITTWGGGA